MCEILCVLCVFMLVVWIVMFNFLFVSGMCIKYNYLVMIKIM